MRNNAFRQGPPHKVKVEEMKAKLWCKTSLTDASWRFDNEAFMRDFLEKSYRFDFLSSFRPYGRIMYVKCMLFACSKWMFEKNGCSKWMFEKMDIQNGCSTCMREQNGCGKGKLKNNICTRCKRSESTSVLGIPLHHLSKPFGTSFIQESLHTAIYSNIVIADSKILCIKRCVCVGYRIFIGYSDTQNVSLRFLCAKVCPIKIPRVCTICEQKLENAWFSNISEASIYKHPFSSNSFKTLEPTSVLHPFYIRFQLQLLTHQN